MAEKKAVYVLDPYHEDAIALLQATPGLHVILPNNPAKSEWKTKADGVILRSETRLTAEDLRQCTRLKVIVKQGVGVDNIDLTGAKECGIAVHNTPALNAESVAELTLALAFSLSRRVTEIDRRIRKGEKIVRSQTLGLSLFKKTVGVVGMGNIGRAAARKWIGACEATIVGFDPMAPEDAWSDIPHKRVTQLDDLLKQSDVITLHVPLTNGTRGMIGAKEIAIMKDRAILINAARGGVVDEKALLQELKQGRIWGAVLDAMEVEPPTADAYSGFFELDNVIMTPHIGASTIENQSNSGIAVVKTLLGVLNGESDAPGKLV